MALSDAGELLLADVETQSATRLDVADGDIRGLAFDPLERWIAIGGDQVIHVIDVETG